MDKSDVKVLIEHVIDSLKVIEARVSVIDKESKEASKSIRETYSGLNDRVYKIGTRMAVIETRYESLEALKGEIPTALKELRELEKKLIKVAMGANEITMDKDPVYDKEDFAKKVKPMAYTGGILGIIYLILDNPEKIKALIEVFK